MCSWTFFVRFTLPCNTAIKQLTDPSSDRTGDPWKIWLNGLAEIAEEVKSLRGEGSVDHPFVQFVCELQKCLPSQCQRDQAAIAEALLEARSKPRKRNKG